MSKSIIIPLLTPFFLVSCHAGSQHGQEDVSADSIPVEMTDVHDVMSNQEKEDSFRFASYLQLFKDTASVEVSIGSKLFGDSSCVYYPGVCVQEYPYAYVTLLRMGDSKEEYTEHYDETILVTYSLQERRMIDSQILGRTDGDNIRCYAIKSCLSPLQLTMRQFVFDAAAADSTTEFCACDVIETEYSIDGQGYIRTKQHQWQDEGKINLSSDFYDPYVYLKSEQNN